MLGLRNPPYPIPREARLPLNTFDLHVSAPLCNRLISSFACSNVFPFSIPRLSSALKTMVNPANHETLNCVSIMFAWCETIFVFGLNFNADSLATYMHTQSVVIASSNVYVDVNSRELWTVWRGAFGIGIGDWDWSYQSCRDQSTAKSVRSFKLFAYFMRRAETDHFYGRKSRHDEVL